MSLHSAIRAGLGFSVLALVLAALVSVMSGSGLLSTGEALGALAGGFLAGVVVEWVQNQGSSTGGGGSGGGGGGNA